jgi:predicted nucleotidyltransferase
MLVLYGSRARGDHHGASDWDFGYLAEESFDPSALVVALVRQLDTDRIDLADLDRGSGLLRFCAARDGRLVFESEIGLFKQFTIAAATFWCDVQPVIARGTADYLRELPR